MKEVNLMPTHTESIDVINKTIPLTDHTNIPVINQPNPCYAYAATAREVWYLVQLPKYNVYAAGTQTAITMLNYYTYFPEEEPQGGGFTPEQWAAINSGITSTDVTQITTNANDISDIQTTIGNVNTVLEEVL